MRNSIPVRAQSVAPSPPIQPSALEALSNQTPHTQPAAHQPILRGYLLTIPGIPDIPASSPTPTVVDNDSNPANHIVTANEEVAAPQHPDISAPVAVSSQNLVEQIEIEEEEEQIGYGVPGNAPLRREDAFYVLRWRRKV